MIAKQLFGLAATMLSLVALYLVLTNFLGATSLIQSAGGAYADLLKTLQGR